MEFKTTFRHIDRSDAVALYAEGRIANRVAKYIARPQGVQMTFAPAAGQFTADCHIAAGRRFSRHFHATAPTLFAAIDALADKVEAALRKCKEQAQEYRIGSQPEPEEPLDDDRGDEDEDRETRAAVEQPESVREAAADDLEDIGTDKIRLRLAETRRPGGVCDSCEVGFSCSRLKMALTIAAAHVQEADALQASPRRFFAELAAIKRRLAAAGWSYPGSARLCALATDVAAVRAETEALIELLAAMGGVLPLKTPKSCLYVDSFTKGSL
jgi:ribosomal subunit interface protein